jgi:GPH family glycoside/pentoside/hexuronide:cation symporter
MTYNVFNAYITFFYADVVKMPAAWVGVGWFAFGFWNAINDPIAGWLSDRTRSKFGRRRFYIRLLALPMALAFIAVWMPPFSVEGAGATAVLFYFLLAISVYDLFQSIITLNQDALFPELYQVAETRAQAATVRQVVGGIGTAFALGLAPAIYDNLGWGVLGVTLGLTAALLHLLSLSGIRENPLYAQNKDEPGLRDQLKLLAQNYIFRLVVGINFIIRFILAVITVAMPYYAQYVLFIPQERVGGLVLAVTASGLLSLLVWQALFRRWGTRRAMMISLALAALFAIPLLFATNFAGAFLALAALGLVVGGTFFIGPDLLFAELVEEDYSRTSVRREGIYRGLLGFVFRFPPALAGLILLASLDVVGYDANLSVTAQPTGVEILLRLFVVLGCMVAVTVGLFLLWRYPLHGERLRQVQAEALRLRQATEAKNKPSVA